MTVQILDETPNSYKRTIKARLGEILALTPDLMKGIKLVVLHSKGEFGSQYLPQRDGRAIINLHLNNVDEQRWRIIPLAWRPWGQAWRLARMLSHALARHMCRSRVLNEAQLRLEAKLIESEIMHRWVPAWFNRLGLWHWSKSIFMNMMRQRMNKIYPQRLSQR